MSNSKVALTLHLISLPTVYERYLWLYTVDKHGKSSCLFAVIYSVICIYRETASSKSSRKSDFTKNEVAMTTGERGLDKRTIASLMVIKHLGTTNRRDR